MIEYCPMLDDFSNDFAELFEPYYLAIYIFSSDNVLELRKKTSLLSHDRHKKWSAQSSVEKCASHSRQSGFHKSGAKINTCHPTPVVKPCQSASRTIFVFARKNNKNQTRLKTVESARKRNHHHIVDPISHHPWQSGRLSRVDENDSDDICIK